MQEKNKVYVVAEMSGNHGGKIEKALEIITAAKRAGANAVKIQTYTADTITLNSKNKDFLIPSDNPWSVSKSLYDLYKMAHTPWEWHEDLFNYAKEIGIDIFSSPFDYSAIEFLEKLDCPIYKIASPEITDIPLLENVAGLGKPVIFSTGVAELKDIQLAYETLVKEGCKDITILKCTSSYPTPFSKMNLKTMVDFGRRFGCSFGLSDHSLGFIAPIVATSLGAVVIEKHFKIFEDDKTVDSFFSLSEAEFSMMVKSIREAEQCLGSVEYELCEEGRKNYWGRRSLYISKDVKKGEVITEKHIRSVRPSFGEHPKSFYSLIGKTAKKNLQYGDRVCKEDFE